VIIRFLQESDFPAVHEAFLKAFSDYIIPLQLSAEQLQDMFIRRAADMSLSVAAFDDDKVAGFTINAVGLHCGLFTAYDVVTGVLPEFRGRRLGQQIFQHCIPELKKAGAVQYLLEVFQANTPAVKLYEKTGFQKSRSLLAFRRDSVQEGRQNPAFLVQEAAPVWREFEEFWDWTPTWQNSRASVERSTSIKVVLGVRKGEEVAGYGVVYPNSGDIPQLAIRHAFRKQGAGSILMRELHSRVQAGRPARVINVDANAEATIAFLLSENFEQFGKQFEMKMQLV